jgi:hypothetical protein
MVNHLTWLKKLLFGVAALVLTAGVAHAQASRTWVSGVGDDANPCSRTAPCKTFPGAISKTAVGGEINCLDSAGFGTVTITKSISIICEGVIGGVLAAGTTGIVINTAAADRVLIQGLDIEGFGNGLSPGIHGISIVGAGSITIRKTTIRNFNQHGIHLVGLNNARVVIDQCLIIGNKQGGLFVQGNGGVPNFAFVNDSVLDNNGPSNVTISSQGNVNVSGSSLHGAAAAFSISGGGAVTSSGDNVVRGTGVPTSTVPKI